MKKTLIWTAIVLVVLIGGKYGFNKVMDNKDYAEKKQASAVQDMAVNKKTDADKKDEKQQTAKIGGVQYEIDLDKDSPQNAVIDVMHKMTHQKVKAEEKWGAVPMIPDTINQVYEIVSNSDYELKDDLLGILEKWKKGQFDEVDEDHNYFWRYKNGNIGKAYGILSKKEEQKFIANNFGEGFAKEVSSQE
ncbi:DUF6241 domain-containing protein [Neobacillus kokaensis]|uniref:CTP synthase n=1 Tax=Neobacillus kokaensis TaxID=2759023 RepID=A0ABQ3MZT5_9BACI|nr:DUF6241 domain-containing protein [Neobacillus kokaensis]GHH97396.1 hypothetical protein AM1BK_09390 [Neobacillus kokaensis]